MHRHASDPLLFLGTANAGLGGLASQLTILQHADEDGIWRMTTDKPKKEG